MRMLLFVKLYPYEDKVVLKSIIHFCFLNLIIATGYNNCSCLGKHLNFEATRQKLLMAQKPEMSVSFSCLGAHSWARQALPHVYFELHRIKPLLAYQFHILQQIEKSEMPLDFRIVHLVFWHNATRFC